MPEKIYRISGFPVPLTAWEWEFERAKCWKIEYNPQAALLPACITCFTHDNADHGLLQKKVDKYFDEVMGRGGNNEKGDSHFNLHNWIEEDYRLADIHFHDHWVIKTGGWNAEMKRDLPGLDTRPDVIVEIFLRELTLLNFISAAQSALALHSFNDWNED